MDDVAETVRKSWLKRFEIICSKDSQNDINTETQNNKHIKREKTSSTSQECQLSKKKDSPKNFIVISSEEEEGESEIDDSDKKINDNVTTADDHLNQLDEVEEVEIISGISEEETLDSKRSCSRSKSQMINIPVETNDEDQVEELGSGSESKFNSNNSVDYLKINENFTAEGDTISESDDTQLPKKKRKKRIEHFNNINIMLSPFKPFHNPLYDNPPLRSTVTIHDILSDSHIESSYLFTYMIELKEFLSYYKDPSTNINIIVQNDHIFDTENINRSYPNLSIIGVRMRPFTSHHCKIVINKYRNEEWKIFLISSNLMTAEFLMNNQICWESPRLPKLNSNLEEDTSKFKYSFLMFLRAYRPFIGSRLDPLIHDLESVNFSSIIGDFISSVPLSADFYDDKQHGFGLKGLIQVLKRNQLLKPTNIDILYQSSSIAAATNHEKKSNKVSNILTHFIIPFITSARPFKLPIGAESVTEYLSRNMINLRIVFPTVNNIILSKFGKASGTWSVFNGYSNIKTISHLKLLKRYLYKPFSNQREYNTSHSKFVIVSSDGFKSLDWCFFTTCNISKQAWGNLVRSGAENYTIQNFESGILISKNHYPGYKLVPVGIGEIENHQKSLANDEIPVTLPFDFKTMIKYESEDQPWCIETFYEDLD